MAQDRFIGVGPDGVAAGPPLLPRLIELAAALMHRLPADDSGPGHVNDQHLFTSRPHPRSSTLRQPQAFPNGEGPANGGAAAAAAAAAAAGAADRHRITVRLNLNEVTNPQTKAASGAAPALAASAAAGTLHSPHRTNGRLESPEPEVGRPAPRSGHGKDRQWRSVPSFRPGEQVRPSPRRSVRRQ